MPTLLLCLLYSILLLPIFKWGVGISPDSVAYYSIAENLYHGNGFTLYDGTYNTNWPWFFPVFLAALKAIPLNLYQLIGIVNILSLSFTFHYLQSKLKNNSFKWLLLILFISPPFIKLILMFWSEAFFMVLLIPALINITQNDKPKFINYVLLAFSGITRYAYLPIALGILVTEIIQEKKLTRKAVLMGLTLLPLGVNIIYNSFYGIKIIDQNISGNQLTRAWLNITQSTTSISSCILFVITVCYLFYCSINKTSKQLLVGLSCYFLLIITFDKLEDVEIIGYLLPITPTLVWLIDKELIIRWFINPIPQILFSGMVILLLVQLKYVIANGTGGYNTLKWDHKALKEIINTYPENELIWSNAPDLIYYITNRKTALLTPESNLNNTSLIIEVKQVRRALNIPKKITLTETKLTSGISVYKIP